MDAKIAKGQLPCCAANKGTFQRRVLGRLSRGGGVTVVLYRVPLCHGAVFRRGYERPVARTMPRVVPCDIYYTVHVEINIHVEVNCHVDCRFLLRIQIACAISN